MTKSIQKHYFKEGLPQEFEIVHYDYLFESHLEDISKTHRAEFYQILWFQKGTPTHLVDFNPIKIKDNTILFLTKDIVQRFDKNLNYSGKSILFTDSFFCKKETDSEFLNSTILFNDLLSVSLIHLQENDTIFAKLFQQMEDELKKPKDHFQSDVLRNNLHNLLLHSERKRRKQNFTEFKKGADLDFFMLFKDLLENRFREQKQVAKFAEQMHITEKRLNHATSKIIGKSPKAVIHDRVILEAKRLLAHTNENIQEIAYSLGFEESTNFIKYFKKHQNSTPIEFREHSQH